MSLRGESLDLASLDRAAAVLQGGGRGRREAPPPHRALQGQQLLDDNVNIDDDLPQPGEFNPDLDIYENCRAGHISGLQPSCDHQGCLDQLEPVERGAGEALGVIPDEVEERMAYVRGLVDEVHVDVVASLSRAQWRYDIYGTVGETGVYEGKFTGILSYNTNYKAGEKLWVIDYFVSDTIEDHLDTFTQNMIDFDLVDMMDQAETGATGSRQIIIQSGDIYSVERDSLRKMGLHQFRMFSIGAELDGVMVSDGLQFASCILRDGGIIVVDGIGSPDAPAKFAVQRHFFEHGHVALSPFLATRNKLYISTTNWKDKYEKYLLDHSSAFSPNVLHERTDMEYGLEFTYLVAE